MTREREREEGGREREKLL